ncbi:hypothetical protein DL764_008113 [Monosporascus ibericus]|uniref:Uncharacterized protein n=1 Tax=Monosporascus ibericus TaxID=155417 RepID=A0A4Q4SYB7_9PEZI|nr:hypothetical protein DL764_008113 [Monosporascus ibericus]
MASGGPARVNCGGTVSGDSDPKKHFRWLRREARGPAYVSYSEFSNRSACAFEFGEDGYAGSCNYGGELLQMTAPSNKAGILFARGDFEYSLYSSLARGQRTFGGKSTFGLKLDDSDYGDRKSTNPDHSTYPRPKPTRFRLGQMIERGCYNYRWPFHEYVLLMDLPKDSKERSNASGDDNSPQESSDESLEVGTCAIASFVKDKILYQVLRLQPECRQGAKCKSIPSNTSLSLSLGGPIKFRLFNSSESGYQGPNSMIPESTRGGCPEPKYEPAKYSLVPRTLNCPESFEPVLEARLFDSEGRHIRLQRTSDEEIERSADEIRYKPCNYCAHFEFPPKEPSDGGSMTFVAAFALYGDNKIFSWPHCPTSEEIYDHLGLDVQSSKKATGAMWQTIFLERDQTAHYIFQPSEVSLVARCLEKILHVDQVPASVAGVTTANGTPACSAIVSNILLQANLDLKSVFRPLGSIPVTTCPNYFARNQTADPENQAELENLINVAGAQVTLIQTCIERVVNYLEEALLNPKRPEFRLLPDHFIPGESNYYYVMITIYYVLKHYPEAKNELGKRIRCGKSGRLFDNSHYLPDDNWDFGSDTRVRSLLLKWYHYESVLRLLPEDETSKFATSQAVVKPKGPSGGEGNWHEWNKKELKEMARKLGREVKMAVGAMISSKQAYTAEDEIVDRLTFLANELDLDAKAKDKFSIAARTIERIKQRDYSREINPGYVPPDDEGQTGGPWEIHALCHHSRLMVANRDAEVTDQKVWEEEIERFRRKLREFLTSESTLTPCWERSNFIARRGWLRSEATSVLASTLLEICQTDFAQNLVDQDVQHRLLIVKKESLDPELTMHFIYVFHPESVDCFNSHALKVTRFVCQKRRAWISRITLKNWSRTDVQQQSGTRINSENTRCQTQIDQQGSIEEITIPKALLKTVENDEDHKLTIELKVSSIVLSTNGFGDFSIGTVISELIPDKTWEKTSKDIRDLWQKFTHQPQTGRCLVFLLLLGVVCEEMASQFRDAMDRLIKVLKLDHDFIHREDEWLDDENSIAQLELSFWSLESLNRIRDTLDDSMKIIDQASFELMEQIREGPGKRSELLEKMCQEYLEDFERRAAELNAVSVYLGSKIELNTRYKDAAIFAVPDAQNAVGKNMGLRWFLGMFFILFSFNAAFAYFLKMFQRRFEILLSWRRVPPPPPRGAPVNTERFTTRSAWSVLGSRPPPGGVLGASDWSASPSPGVTFLNDEVVEHKDLERGAAP